VYEGDEFVRDVKTEEEAESLVEELKERQAEDEEAAERINKKYRN
jgi:hypothetical protein